MFKVRNGLQAGDAAEHEGAQNRNRIRGCSVKMPGHFASRIEAGKRAVATQHLGLCVGRKAAERVRGGDWRSGPVRRDAM